MLQGAENFTTPNVHLTVSRASSSAIEAIEALSGTLVARYENRLTLVSFPRTSGRVLPELTRGDRSARLNQPHLVCPTRAEHPQQGRPCRSQGSALLQQPQAPRLLGEEGAGGRGPGGVGMSNAEYD